MSIYYKKFVIPVGNMTKEQAEKTLAELMKQYHEDVNFDEVGFKIKMKVKDRKEKFQKLKWL